MSLKREVPAYTIPLDNGFIEYSYYNWSGIAYRIPRAELETGGINNKTELSGASGVYLLFEEKGKKVYIGESGDILNRLKTHLTERKWRWEYAITFICLKRLGRSKITWLEKHFYDLAKRAGNYEVEAGKKPENAPPIENIEELEVKEFAENAKMILSITGNNIFELTEDQKPPIKEPRYYGKTYEELTELMNKNNVRIKESADEGINRMRVIMVLNKTKGYESYVAINNQDSLTSEIKRMPIIFDAPYILKKGEQIISEFHEMPEELANDLVNSGKNYRLFEKTSDDKEIDITSQYKK